MGAANLPSILESQRFHITSLGKNARNRDYQDAFMWLADGNIVNQCFNSTDPSIGLVLNMDSPTMKCYMADTGLLVTMAFSDDDTTREDIYEAILADKLRINEGMIVENMVSQMLRSTGHRLFFYSSAYEGSSRIEIDFLIKRGSKITPIEVKSTKNVKHASLDKFVQRFGSRLGTPVVLYPGDVKERDGVLYLPLYMAGMLRRPGGRHRNKFQYVIYFSFRDTYVI